MHTLFAFLASCFAALISWLCCVAAIRFWHSKKGDTPPALFYSAIKALQGATSYGLARFVRLPYFLLLGALALLLLAWWNPPFPAPASHLPLAWNKQLPLLPSEGMAYYLLIDRSGSMNQISPFAFKPMRKIDLLKQSTLEFIQNGESASSDLIGMIGFARSAEVLSPLTLDTEHLKQIISKLDVVKTTEEEGTGIGYAIFKAVQLIAATQALAKQESDQDKEQFQIKNAFLIVLTDGFQDPNPLDQGKWLRTMGLEEAARYAKKEGVKLYIINMEPSLEQERFAPHRHLLESVTQLTGGRFFLLSQNKDLSDIYQSIRSQEETLLPLGMVGGNQLPATPHLPQRSPIVPYLLLLSLSCLAAAVIFLSTSHKMVP